jgi:hypothetical protein
MLARDLEQVVGPLTESERVSAERIARRWGVAGLPPNAQYLRLKGWPVPVCWPAEGPPEEMTEFRLFRPLEAVWKLSAPWLVPWFEVGPLLACQSSRERLTQKIALWADPAILAKMAAP